MALAEDASSPGAFSASGSGASISTTAFSPPAGSLVIALVAVEKSGVGTTAIVSDSNGNQLGKVVTAKGGPWSGIVSIWALYYTSAPGSITVSTAFAGGTFGGRFMDVRVITGADPIQYVSQGWAAAYGTQGTTTGAISLTTTQSSSMVYGISSSPTAQVSSTAWDANTTKLVSHDNTTDVTEAVSWKQTSLTGTPGTVVRGVIWGSSQAGNVAAFEIVPLGTSPGAPTMPTFTDGSIPHASDIGVVNTNITNLHKLTQGGVRWAPYVPGAKGPTKPMCLVTCASPTDTLSAGVNTLIHFDTALINTDHGWDAMNNPFIVMRTAGLWRVDFTVQVVGQASVGKLEAAILYNGLSYSTNVLASCNVLGTAVSVSATVQASGGSFFDFYATAAVAGTLGYATAVAEWLSP